MLGMWNSNMEGAGDVTLPSVTPAANYILLDFFAMRLTWSWLIRGNLTPDYQMVLTSYPSASYSLHASYSGFPVPIMLQAYSHLETLYSLFYLPGMLFFFIFPSGSAQTSPLQRGHPRPPS